MSKHIEFSVLRYISTTIYNFSSTEGNKSVLRYKALDVIQAMSDRLFFTTNDIGENSGR